MKKNFYIIFFSIGVVILTILNFSMFYSTVEGDESLKSLIQKAIADGEGGEGCYEQLTGRDIYPIDECREFWYTWFECWDQGTLPECIKGYTNSVWNTCNQQQESIEYHQQLCVCPDCMP